MAEKDPLFGRFDIFQTRPNIISIALALCYFGATILKSFPEAGLDHFTFLYHNYYSSPFRNKNTAAKSLRCKAFTMLIYIKIDRPLPWWSVNLSWRRWRDLNPRTPCGAYRISNPDPSATWVHLHWQLTPPLCHIPAQVASPLLRFLPADAGWGRNRPLPAPIGRFRGSRGPWGDSSGSGRTEPGSEPPQPSLSEWRWFPRRSATAARTAAPPPARRWHTRA